MRKYLFCFGLGLMLFNACEEKDQASDLMVLSTHEVEINGSTENGIQFSASILLESGEAVVEQGFAYGLMAEPDFQDVVLKVPPTGKRQFKIVLEDALRSDTTYYVRSFVRTEKFLIYGNEVSFYSNGTAPPLIETIEPEMALWGDTIQITGQNFDRSGKQNTIWFGEFKSTKTWGSCDTLFAIVPDELNRKRSDISVKLYGKASENKKVFEIPSPIVTKVSHTNGQFPDTIIISGNHFSEKHGSVEFGGRASRSFTSGRDSLMFIVPFIGEEERVSVHLKQLDEKVLITDEFRYNEQKILGVSGLSIYVMDPITIYAQNIDFRRVDLMVDIDNVSYVNSQVWQDSLRIEPPYYGHEYVGAEFSMTCQIYNFISGEFQTIHQQTIPHR
ncbi:IPT/TIG domain-containing protein [Geofilum rubicundum]|uniref:IPT/TIG domain-containing protein n=1 Tax=Geofilum rubicundum JCM 15548 TaxID=1236989 RepID=A0A0E9LYV8_9BACT|nr:IPT/TIG domain-containing protein [Geofilum rubicundum]GAO30050.1 hypothetical protein JCM15548_12294 [Geofilum rubicundum JCM 15548]